MDVPSLSIAALRKAYAERALKPSDLVRSLLTRMDATMDRKVWIARIPARQMLEMAAALDARVPEELPLYGIPFAIKDNLDLAGIATTAGCPRFAYVPERSASVVARLVAAGALPLGKTNLDQFATGLVGTRSPYGMCANAFDSAYIAGGSSSGSALAVALDLASFALGTDTAGSGRVPAAFNDLVGLKPSCGRLSNAGMVPACRSLDCVSVFARTAADARAVLDVAEGFDAGDPWSRHATQPARSLSTVRFRFGVPQAAQLQFFGDTEYARLFGLAIERLVSLGGERVEIDFAPFLETARLLYEGPWVAERYAAVGEFVRAHPGALYPVTEKIIAAGAKPSAVDAFQAQYRLKALQRATSSAWDAIDVLVTPTAGTIYRLAQVEQAPIELNSNLGYYTNFVNLLDLAAVAVPAGFRNDGLPFGITLLAPAMQDHALLELAERFHAADAPRVAVAVCGAHMQGLPLNRQLLERGGRLLQRTRSAPIYRLYALPGGPPHRPGMIRVEEGGGAIDLEVWSITADRFGDFVAGIPAPLGIGKVKLADGSEVSGFTCEGYAAAGARDITSFGGWRAWLASSSPAA
jgi:allophanate hydrolase